MIRSTLANFQYTGLTCIGMLLFVAVFCGAILWVYRRGSKDVYEEMRKIPLEGSYERE